MSTPQRRARHEPRPRILIVDDEVSILESLQRILETAGYRVVAVPDADQACTRVVRTVFDAIILDIRLAGARSGLEVLQFLRWNEQSAEIPAIVLTGVPHLGAEEEDIIRRCGAYVFFKPQIPELVKCLDALTRH